MVFFQSGESARFFAVERGHAEIVALIDEWAEVSASRRNCDFICIRVSWTCFKRYLVRFSRQITVHIAASNLAFFKSKICDEGQRKEKEALAPWVKRLPSIMRLRLDDWAVKMVSDMHACFTAFFLGSGCVNDRLVKLRRLVFGRVFWCCRSRLVAYLVPRAPVRQRICTYAAFAAPAVYSSATTELTEGRMKKRPRLE